MAHGKHILSYFGPKLWKKLSKDCGKSETINKFKVTVYLQGCLACSDIASEVLNPYFKENLIELVIKLYYSNFIHCTNSDFLIG